MADAFKSFFYARDVIYEKDEKENAILESPRRLSFRRIGLQTLQRKEDSTERDLQETFSLVFPRVRNASEAVVVAIYE